MSDQTTTPKSWGSTIAIGVILLVLAIGLIFFIYYIFLQPTVPPLPLSPFKFGDVIQIVPAVLTKENANSLDINQDQYLIKNECSSYPCSGCYQPFGANPSSCVATFSGSKNNPNTKWILEQLPYTGTKYPAQSTDQNVLANGNRFYLRNLQNGSTDVSGRLFFSLFNSTCSSPSCQGLSPDISFPISTQDITSNCYQPDTLELRGNELVVYFLPSSQPDLYYILLPGSLDVKTCFSLRTNSESVTTQPNNGVVTLRPYAPANTFQTTYNPFMPNGELYNNGMLLNAQYNYPVGRKYPAPEVFLFKITKA